MNVLVSVRRQTHSDGVDTLPLAGDEPLLLQPVRLLLDERQISRRFPPTLQLVPVRRRACRRARVADGRHHASTHVNDLDDWRARSSGTAGATCRL